MQSHQIIDRSESGWSVEGNRREHQQAKSRRKKNNKDRQKRVRAKLRGEKEYELKDEEERLGDQALALYLTTKFSP